MTKTDIIVGLNNIAAKYGYGKGTEPFTNDEWNTIFHAKGIIKHLIAENKRLKEEAAEQKSIAAHEHATQMEWFWIACDYKAKNAELRATISKMETVEKELRARLDNAVELSYSYLEMLKLLACVSKCYANLNCNSTRGFDEIKNATDAFKDCLAEAEARLAERKGGRE